MADAFIEIRWEVIEQGRPGVFRMGGSTGSLDLIVVYSPTGAGPAIFTDTEELIHAPLATQRARLRVKVNALRPASSCLSVVAGDSNWVADPKDRALLHNSAASGIRD